MVRGIPGAVSKGKEGTGPMSLMNWPAAWPLLMAPPPAEGSTAPSWVTFLPMVVLLALMYFVLLRPQMKRQKEHEKLIAAVKTGDRVVAAGGIYGTVTNLKDQVLVLKVADGVKIEVQRSTITSVEKNEDKPAS
ncbi:MAG: preprotein translocase subunit YajC [Verrucomicrobia bacterium]|nr:preprotein translocase subunit YajC [Verrucomicrobiota bacterium]NBU68709.1 preprotein translocase subunit YajC [Verrucomicrobiota bacterium]NDB99913.1 preprotein translocase subunit YajC [Verrucomicrobiota bacterium]NDF17423.1 preprotein translocase subunit YajC [Verrucomicrobiota bacterium]